MIVLSRGRFTLAVSPLGEKGLEDYGLRLFRAFDKAASGSLPLKDYGLRLEIDEGSLKGKGLVLATVAGLYYGIGAFGSFMSGLREMESIGKKIAGEFIEEAPRQLDQSPPPVRWSKRDSGTVGQLRRLFRQVHDGELTADEATAQAVVLLQASGDAVPPALANDISQAAHSILGFGPQMDFLADSMENQAEEPSSPVSPRPLGTHDGLLQPPRRRLHLEIYRDSLSGKEHLSIEPL